MKITNDTIKALNLCKERFNNYLLFYKGKSHTKAQFMGLKNIYHSDKLWVALRLMPIDKVRLAAADIAESVLHLFESKYPNDLRPREAIEAARSNTSTADAAACAAADAAADAAHAALAAAYAAADVADAAAYAASRAALAANAAAAAAYAADAAAHAALAAAYAANAANAAAVIRAKGAREAQEKLIRKIILKYWKEK